MENEVTTTPLTTREKLAIKLLLIIFQVVKPFNWGHECDKHLADFNELLKEKI